MCCVDPLKPPRVTDIDVIAANVRFSNWVSGSSWFSFFYMIGDRLSGSRFSSQSVLVFEWHRCMRVSDWLWRALLPGALQFAQQTFSSSSADLVRIGRSRQVDWGAF
jgi:hypothetical protein